MKKNVILRVFREVVKYCDSPDRSSQGHRLNKLGRTPVLPGRGAVGRASDSRARGPGFDTRSGHMLSFLLPLVQEGQLSVTGESTCTEYWLTA